MLDYDVGVEEIDQIGAGDYFNKDFLHQMALVIGQVPRAGNFDELETHLRGHQEAVECSILVELSQPGRFTTAIADDNAPFEASCHERVRERREAVKIA